MFENVDHFSGTDEAHPILRMTAAVSEHVKEVQDVDPVFMAPADRARALAELGKVQDQLHLLELGVLRVSDDLAADAGHKSVATWRQATQHRDGAIARREERLAEALGERWTATASAVRDGRATLEQAQRIVRALDNLADALETEWDATLERATDEDDDKTAEQRRITREWITTTLARAEARLIELAADHTPTELDRLGEGILSLVAPHHADELERRALERAERRASSETRLTAKNRGDGTYRIWATLPAATWATLKTYLGSLTSPRVTASAAGGQAGPGSTSTSGIVGGPGPSRQLVDPWIDSATGRRIPQERRRGQAFVALMERISALHLPQHGGLGASVVVTIDWQSLHDAVGHGTIGDPDGDGVRVSVGDVRRLACASGIIPAVLGSDSVPLDLGRTSRLFSSAQRKAHAIGHPTCEATGCSVPATWCESHHKRDPWVRGGATDRDDLAFLCPWHHHRAHDPGCRTTWQPHGGAIFHRRT